MSKYYLSTDDIRELRAYIEEHKARGWRNADSVIVATERRCIGFKFRAVRFPDICAFWPPKKDRHFPSIEVFGWSLSFEREYHDFFDHVEFDPIGEYPQGAKVEAIQKMLKAKAATP